MSTLEHAKVYLDLPKRMQDDDALEFARAVISLYELLDDAKARIAAVCAYLEGQDSSVQGAFEMLSARPQPTSPRAGR